jgi:hypothetical protein
VRKRLNPVHRDDGIELRGDRFFGGARLALAERLTDTQYRRQARFLRGFLFARNDVARLAEQGAALGMSDDHVTTAEIDEHRA